MTTIEKLVLTNYKAFGTFTINFKGSAFIVGPNNAGKTTIIQALRACAGMLNFSSRKKAFNNTLGGIMKMNSYSFPKDNFSIIGENIRHEFRSVETKIELTFSNGASLTAIWPIDSDGNGGEPYFFLLDSTGKYINNPNKVREIFPPIGIVPTLMPIEQIERVITEAYVKNSVDTRRSSRHFRNNLFLLRQGNNDYDGDYLSFLDFLKVWAPEVEIIDLVKRIAEEEPELDLFYRENISRYQKEISWIGDGMQIWLQILFHIYRLRSSPVIILDEPDVYLHADLQRRLVRLIESETEQSITATHSAEVLNEIEPSSMVWVDRTRKKAVHTPSGDLLNQFSESLGTQFNLKLARVLRTKVAIFVEGDDMKILRELAKTSGAHNIADENNITIVPLEGFSKWQSVEPFSWLIDNLLEKCVKTFVVLDKDYRSVEACLSLKNKFKKISVEVHIWKYKELENYLLDLQCLSRLTKAPVEWINANLNSIIEQMEDDVRARMEDEEIKQNKPTPQRHRVDIVRAFSKNFKTLWSDIEDRVHLCPPKDVLSELNKRLKKSKFTTTSFRALARNMRAEEIKEEMVEVFKKIESLL